jgi:hypothetical protein
MKQKKKLGTIIFTNLLKILKIKLYAPSSIGTKSVKVPPINQPGQMVTIYYQQCTLGAANILSNLINTDTC